MPDRSRLLQVWNSSHHFAFSLVIVEADSTSASGPRSAASASLKSPVEMPFR